MRRFILLPLLKLGARRLTRVLAVAVLVLLGLAGNGSSRVDASDSAHRLPRFGPLRYVGASHESGSVYVTDAIASADFSGDGLADVVYATANSGSRSTYAMQFAVNRGRGRFVDGASRLFAGAVPRTQGGGRLVVADFNNDGRPDVYYADSGAEAAPNPPGFHDTLVLSTPDGKLVDATANIPRQSDFTHSAAAADVNGDGSIDLFIVTAATAAASRSGSTTGLDTSTLPPGCCRRRSRTETRTASPAAPSPT
jgi:hypothetical protein